MELSAGRLDQYTKQVIERWHLQIVDSIPELCRQVDAVLLLSVDGRKHLEQARAVFAAGKPVFIDKPFASSFKEAEEIVQLSRKTGVPFFSSSTMRFATDITELQQDATLGRVEGAFTFGPGLLEAHVPDLFWYCIHAVESLYTLMGPGCERVTRVHTEGEESVVGLWKDGRIGAIRGLRSSPRMEGAIVFGTKRTAVSRNLMSEKPAEISAYPQLCSAIVKFFTTRVPPVQPEETLEIIAFMEAADRSRDRGGAPVSLAEIMSASR